MPLRSTLTEMVRRSSELGSSDSKRKYGRPIVPFLGDLPSWRPSTKASPATAPRQCMLSIQRASTHCMTEASSSRDLAALPRVGSLEGNCYQEVPGGIPNQKTFHLASFQKEHRGRGNARSTPAPIKTPNRMQAILLVL